MDWPYTDRKSYHSQAVVAFFEERVEALWQVQDGGLGGWAGSRSLQGRIRRRCAVSVMRCPSTTRRVRVKHLLHHAVLQLVKFESWSLIPEHPLADIRRCSVEHGDRALFRDQHTFWSAPPNPQTLKDKFVLSDALKAQAQKRKDAAEDNMPPVVGNFVLAVSQK